MKLFQIEEPDGSPLDPAAPGVAIGIDVAGPVAEVAVSVGGNATLLTDRDGFALDLTVPATAAQGDDWQLLFEGARLRAERNLGRPVTHAVIVVAASPDRGLPAQLAAAAEAAGLELLRVVAREAMADAAAAGPAALAAAIFAEELAPRPPAP